MAKLLCEALQPILRQIIATDNRRFTLAEFKGELYAFQKAGSTGVELILILENRAGMAGCGKLYVQNDPPRIGTYLGNGCNIDPKDFQDALPFGAIISANNINKYSEYLLRDAKHDLRDRPRCLKLPDLLKNGRQMLYPQQSAGAIPNPAPPRP